MATKTELKQKIEKLEVQNENLESKINSRNTDISNLEDYIDEIKSKLDNQYEIPKHLDNIVNTSIMKNCF